MRSVVHEGSKQCVRVAKITAGINIINSSRVLPVVGQDVGHMVVGESIKQKKYSRKKNERARGKKKERQNIEKEGKDRVGVKGLNAILGQLKRT